MTVLLRVQLHTAAANGVFAAPDPMCYTVVQLMVHPHLTLALS